MALYNKSISFAMLQPLILKNAHQNDTDTSISSESFPKLLE